MSYNASKCKHLSLTIKQKPLETTYFLAGNILSKSACEKEQGVSVNSELSWHDHIVNKVNKAYEVVRLTRRNCEIVISVSSLKNKQTNILITVKVAAWPKQEEQFKSTMCHLVRDA